MKTSYLIFAVVFVAVMGGVWYYLDQNRLDFEITPLDPGDAEPPESSSSQETSQTETPEETTTPEELEEDTDALTPDQITEAMIDTAVEVTGEITRIHQDSTGIALWLRENGESIGVRIESQILETMTEEEIDQIAKGNRFTAHGILVLTDTHELFIVHGIIPPPTSIDQSNIEIIQGPTKISNNPEGFDGWPWPRLYTYGDRMAVTYWSIEEDWLSRWFREWDDGWGEPIEVPANLAYWGETSYSLDIWNYTGYENQGSVGVVLKVFSEDLVLLEEYVIDTTPTDNDVDKNPKPNLVVDSTGVVHIVWEINAEDVTDIYYTSFNGTGFSEYICISLRADVGSFNPSIFIDAKDVVYITWAETDTGMYGGRVDVYYRYLKEGVWSERINLSNTSDLDEHGVMPFYPADATDPAHAYFTRTDITQHRGTMHIEFSNGETTIEEIPFSFTDIATIEYNGDLYAIYGGWIPIDSTSWNLYPHISYNYREDGEWKLAGGLSMLPEEFIANSEILTLIPESIGSNYQPHVMDKDGATDLYREIHPEMAHINEVFYLVFEHNNQGTYDAYYMTFKIK